MDRQEGPGQTRAGSSTSQGLHRGSSRSRPRRPPRSLHRFCFLLHHWCAASSTGATASMSSSGPRPSMRCTFSERGDVGIRIRSKTAENKTWEGARAAASEAGRDGESPFFLHHNVAARSQHAEPPAQNGRGEATPFRPKTARESYSKARPSAARFGRSGGQRHPYAFLNNFIKRPCERYFSLGARV